jgi:Ca2+-binding EF-hand superfamily protein
VLPLAKIAADNLDVAIERFGQFDTDKNGAIDIHELKQADRSMPAYVRESAFRRIDVNRDGRITIEEFDEDAGMAIQEKFQ